MEPKVTAACFPSRNDMVVHIRPVLLAVHSISRTQEDVCVLRGRLWLKVEALIVIGRMVHLKFREVEP